jgi:hypothetical protein
MLPVLFTAAIAALHAVGPVRPLPEQQPAPIAIASGALGCDDGTAGGTLIERAGEWYGNRFVPDCGAALLVRANFVHAAYDLPGPYAFRLRLLDAACRELGATPQISIPASPGTVAAHEIDLAPYGWCIDGPFQILIEPLTWADAEGQDCFPALVVDASADADAEAHCATVSTAAAEGRQCFAARSADGRYFDFALRAELECAASECATPVAPSTWSRVKARFR